MRFVPEPVSHLRLTRIHRWAMLWLKWFAAFLDTAGAFAPLSKQTQEIAHRWLDSIERIIVAIVMLRAAPRVRRLDPRKGVAEHRRNDAGFRRALIGSALRRTLRPKNLFRRIAALTQGIATLVARLLRRLPRGLTRRRAIKVRPEAYAVALCAQVSLCTLPPDTS